MIGDFRATLYDLFGYLVPGVVAVVAFGLMWHRLFSGTPVLAFPLPTSVSAWVPFLFVSYIAGHLVQAIANATRPFNLSADNPGLGGGNIPASLMAIAKTRIAAQLGKDVKDIEALSSSDVWALIDEVAADATGTANREIYIYREGFYRGMAVATSLLAVSLLAHFGKSICMATAISAGCTGPTEVIAAFVVSCAATVGFFLRMRRFGYYRIQRSLYRSLLADRAATTKQS